MPIRCRTVVARLPDHEEGRLSRLARSGIHLHLAVCRECGTYLKQLRAVQAALGALQGDGVAPTTKAVLLEKFRAWHAGLARSGS